MTPKELTEIQEVSPMVTISKALASGANLVELKELLAMQRDWESNEARKAYARSMSIVQKNIPIVIKTSVNKQTNSKYAKEEAISKAVKPVYTEEGFSLSFDIGESNIDKHIRVICHMLHSSGHKEDRHIDYPYDLTGMQGTVNKTPIHAYKSTISYAKNTLTCMVFNVATGDDNDGNIEEEKLEENKIKILRVLMEEVKVDESKFLEYLKIEKVEDMKKSDFLKAKVALEAKKKVTQ